MFVKEGSYDNSYVPDYNLFLLQSTWAITLSADSSNLLYSCKAPQGSLLPRPPEYGWQAVGGEDPPPMCVWNSTKADKLSGKYYVAPNLSNSFTKKCGDDRDHDEGVPQLKTLGSMMCLPVDE